MREQLTRSEEQQQETQEVQTVKELLSAENAMPTEDAEAAAATPKKKMERKKIIIGGVILLVIVVLAAVFLIPSKFERVKSEAVQIAGMVSGSGDYFMIDTYPDSYKNMDEVLASILLPQAQEDALEAIRYVNKELGFDGSVYSLMMKTTALMGRQTEENNKYKISWTYHPDEGLEVTYRKKECCN